MENKENKDNKDKFFYTNSLGYVVVWKDNDDFDTFKNRVAYMETLRKDLSGEKAKSSDSKSGEKKEKINWRKCDKHDKWYNADKYSKCSICAEESQSYF